MTAANWRMAAVVHALNPTVRRDGGVGLRSAKRRASDARGVGGGGRSVFATLMASE
jgi:hypothetical protein